MTGIRGNCGTLEFTPLNGLLEEPVSLLSLDYIGSYCGHLKLDFEVKQYKSLPYCFTFMVNSFVDQSLWPRPLVSQFLRSFCRIAGDIVLLEIGL